ncbi:MAG TPA: shikimate kinase [Nannocystis sp.]
MFLTGMMGAGKSTVGALLAQRWGVPFVDLDVRIARIFGASPAALLARGEAHFRRCERAALRLLVAEPGFVGRTTVVATGGGVVVDPDNRAVMRAAGVVLFLDVPPLELARRLGGDSLAARPLLGSDPAAILMRVTELLGQRRSAYEEAHGVVDGSGPPQDVARRLLMELAAHCHHT